MPLASSSLCGTKNNPRQFRKNAPMIQLAKISNSFGETLRVGDRVRFGGRPWGKPDLIITAIEIPDYGNPHDRKNFSSIAYNHMRCILNRHRIAHPSVLTKK